MIVVTERTILRKFEISDLDQLIQLHSDPQVMKYSVTGVRSIETINIDIKGYIEDYQKIGFGKLAIIDKNTKIFIGRAGFSYMPNQKDIELGYTLKVEYWGKGLATEICNALINYARQELKLKQLVAFTHIDNVTSQKVLEKSGMHFTCEEIIYGMRSKLYEINLL